MCVRSFLHFPDWQANSCPQVDEVMEMIVRGNECRTMSPTEANATSSRSHAVLQINVAQKDRAAGTNEPHTMATLSIIDLAGSERASATKNRGEQLKEGANINKSLLALGSCINALCDPRRRNHIPYRDSKLTRLLKFSLGGNCKTVMIVCVSPSSIHYDETQNTLRYANRAKNIQTKVTRNVFNVNRHVKDFLKKIDEQMTLINELKSQQKDYENVAFTKLRKQNEKREAIVREGLGRLRNSYDHSQGDRHERINSMKKLRQIEKRISMINTWMVAFDNVCEAREEEDPPRTLLAMRKTAQGILVELESSRHHYHQRLSKSTWQRAIDTALSVGIDQLRAVEGGVEPLEMASLEREAELLKTNAERELHMAVLEQEKVGDAGLMHVLLTAHFETVAIINQLMYMEEREAVTAARGLLNKMLASCADATSHLIRPDGSMPITQPLPPTKSGTPRRTKTINLMGPSPKKPIVPAVDEMRRMTASPTKGSPRKRAVLGVARRGVSFTPKRTPSKRAVRWRDDTQEGALAEYEKTPQHMKATPPQPGVAPLQERDTLPLSRIPAPFGDRSSPSHIRLSSSPITAPPTACSQLSPENRPPQASSDRFKAGFLSRKSNDSPVPPTLSALPASSSPDPSPLSESTSSRVNARSSLERYRSSISSAQPHHAASSSGNDSSSGSGSDSERDVEGTGRTSWIPSNDSDAAKIKAAVKRASLSRSSSQRTQRRRSPSTASAATGTGSSPPRGSDGAVIAGSAKRLAERDAAWRHSSVLSPRTTAAAVQKPAGRRATTIMNDERLLGRSATRGHARASTSITAPTLASAQRASINGRPGSAGTWR